MNAAGTTSAAPDRNVSSMAGLTAIVAGSNHRTEDIAPTMNAAPTKTSRIGKA